MAPAITVRELQAGDRLLLGDLWRERWGGETVVTRGRVHRLAEVSGFLAEIEGRFAGALTYSLSENDCEIVTLDAVKQRAGVGTALLTAVRGAAGNRRLWLITTNDNLDAVHFYQRRGFVLAAVHPNAIEVSRRLKPQIPLIGSYGIPIRDELEFVAEPVRR
jgi:GNAT superfamily N-acetyltransferase